MKGEGKRGWGEGSKIWRGPKRDATETEGGALRKGGNDGGGGGGVFRWWALFPNFCARFCPSGTLHWPYCAFPRLCRPVGTSQCTSVYRLCWVALVHIDLYYTVLVKGVGGGIYAHALQQ